MDLGKTPMPMTAPFITLARHLPRIVCVAALLAPPGFGLLGGAAQAKGCIKMGSTQSCLKDECRAGFCVHVGTYYTPTGISTELDVNSRPASGTHLNLRCLGGQQKEGVSMKCGGSSIAVQSCTRGKLFSRSRCGPWQSFSGK